MTIIFEAQNANEDFVKLVKSAAKLANVKIKTQRDKPNDFIPFTESESYKMAKEYEATLSDEQKKAAMERVESLTNRNYNDEL